MKSKIMLIINIGIVLIFLAGAAVALKLTAPADEEEQTAEEEVTSSLIFDKDPTDIKTLTITNSYGSYAVERFGDEGGYAWTVLEYLYAPVSSTQINTLLNKAATLTAQQTVVENAEDLSIYGLSEPTVEYKVEFDDSQNTVKEICIGSSVPGKSGKSYMYLKGSPTVYTVNTSDVSCFTQDKTECINKTVYTAYTSDDENDTTDYTRINKMTIQRKDLDYDIVIEYDTRLDDENAVVSNSSSYRMTSPVTLDLNPDKCTDVIQGVFGLTADSFALLNPTEEDLEEYGFSDPTAIITMNIVGGDFRMLVGDPYNDEDGNQAGYYAIVEGYEVVYMFSNSKLPWVSVMPLDITTTMITSNYIYGVSSIDITGNAEAHFTMTGSEASDFAVKLNGNDVDSDSFKTFYQFILRAPAEQLCFDDVSGEPALTIAIRSASGNDTIEFYPTENRRTIIRLNGITSFTCKTAYLDRLIENIGKFENGEDLITNW